MMKCFFCFLFISVSFLHTTAAQQPVGDEFWTTPKKPYNVRRSLYLNYCVTNGLEGGRDGIFSQVARLELGLPVNDSLVRTTIAVVYENKDCNDFALGGLLRLYYLNKSKAKLSAKLVRDIEKCLLNFKYWWDEPIKDTAYRCYHTENHQGLYHHEEMLAGQLLKDKKFKNGMTGTAHIQHARIWLQPWLDWRMKFGFSEWLSNNYLDVDMMTLANLHDFAEDEQIRNRAGLLLDMLLYDMALNNFHGVFGSTHGRTYNRSVLGGRMEATSSAMKLMFGVGIFNSPRSMGAVSLATSTYRCPAMIEHIAVDYSTPMVNDERESIDVKNAPNYGLSYTNELDIGMFWGMQEFIHPDVIDLSAQVSQKYDVWPYRNYEVYKKQYQEQVKQYGKIINPDLDRYALPEVNLTTFRTPYFMLSCAQDYHPGKKGYQQHIWQATLGTDAVVFTNHPGESTPNPVGKESSPAYWAGNKILPRAAQYKNVVVCIYDIPADDPLPFSHAYFPRNTFDEVAERGHWVFGRKDSTYIALYSQNMVAWQKNNKGQMDELRSSTPKNTWICEMGDKKQWKSFEEFINQITKSKISCTDGKVDYRSPSAGLMHFGWSGPLTVKGIAIPLNDYPRFDNPFCKNGFLSNKIKINYHNQKLVLDFNHNKREESKRTNTL